MAHLVSEVLRVTDERGATSNQWSTHTVKVTRKFAERRTREIHDGPHWRARLMNFGKAVQCRSGAVVAKKRKIKGLVLRIHVVENVSQKFLQFPFHFEGGVTFEDDIGAAILDEVRHLADVVSGVHNNSGIPFVSWQYHNTAIPAKIADCVMLFGRQGRVRFTRELGENADRTSTGLVSLGVIHLTNGMLYGTNHFLWVKCGTRVEVQSQFEHAHLGLTGSVRGQIAHH